MGRNPLRIDPSRTLSIQRQYLAAVTKAFWSLKSAIIQLVWRDDAFGLADDGGTDFPIRHAAEEFHIAPPLTANAKQFAFTTDAQKLEQFRQWLEERIAAGELTDIGGQYIESAFKKGRVRGFNQANAKDLDERTFLDLAFAAPESRSKVELLAQRSYETLKGITDDMASKMNRILADGLIEGKGPRELARELTAQVELSRERAMLVARTELIHAHAEGQLDSYEDLGVEQVGLDVEVEILTAGDDRVCPECEEAAANGPYSIDAARGLLPIHPNCRCAFAPVTKGGQDRATSMRNAVRASLERVST